MGSHQTAKWEADERKQPRKKIMVSFFGPEFAGKIGPAIPGLPGGLIIYQGNPSISPKRTPMIVRLTLCDTYPKGT